MSIDYATEINKLMGSMKSRLMNYTPFSSVASLSPNPSAPSSSISDMAPKENIMTRSAIDTYNDIQEWKKKIKGGSFTGFSADPTLTPRGNPDALPPLPSTDTAPTGFLDRISNQFNNINPANTTAGMPDSGSFLDRLKGAASSGSLTDAFMQPGVQGLLRAGLGILATPPREVPYSPLEVLGRGGLEGLKGMEEAQRNITTRDMGIMALYPKMAEMLRMSKPLSPDLQAKTGFTDIGDLHTAGPSVSKLLAPTEPTIKTPAGDISSKYAYHYMDQGGKSKTAEQLSAESLEKDPTTGELTPKAQAAQATIEKMKKDKTDTGTAADLRYQDAVKRQTLGEKLSSAELADIKAYEKRKTLGTTTGATLRFEGLKDIYNDIRNTPVYNNETGQYEFASNREISEGKKSNRYAPPGAQAGAMKQQNLLQDIAGQVTRTKESVNALKKDFTSDQVAQLALVMESRDPSSAWSNFMGSSFAKTLTPDQQTFVVRILQLKEQAMAMRAVLGAGQGSDMMRLAIEKTLPGTLNVSKSFALEQLNEFEQTLKRLQRYIPKVRQVPGTGGAEGGELPAGFKRGW